MTKIEFDVRLTTIGERIRTLHGELIAMMEVTPSHAKKNRLHLAAVHLQNAADEVETESPLDLETTLRLSIQQVQQRRDRRQCAEVGSEVLSTTNEKAHAANVSPFVNRQLFQSGE